MTDIRITTETDLLRFLEQNQIDYQRIEHPAVYTCEEAEKFRPEMPAVSTKNLFLCDKRKKHYYLLMTACEKRMDFKQLASQVGVSKMRFGSEADLFKLLGVTRGAVTVLGLANDNIGLAHDNTGQVQLLMDGEIQDEAHFLCHPLVNTATLVLSKQSLEHFLKITGHTITTVFL
jgi:Ala-tRNA(Pro) deacylase